MPSAHAEGDGTALFKRTSSAFASTDLDRHLPGAGIADLIVTAPSPGSVSIQRCVGADLGFATAVIRAAVIGFDLSDAALSARVLFDVTMTFLEADFVTMVESMSIVAATDREGGSAAAR